jgi:hypothetical protein
MLKMKEIMFCIFNDKYKKESDDGDVSKEDK